MIVSLSRAQEVSGAGEYVSSVAGLHAQMRDTVHPLFPRRRQDWENSNECLSYYQFRAKQCSYYLTESIWISKIKTELAGMVGGLPAVP